MSLRNLVVKMVGVADKITKPFQGDVILHRYESEGQYGDENYDDPLTLQAIVDQTVSEHRLKSGRVVAVKAYVAIIQPIPPNGTAGRVEPVDVRDKLILPDGTTGPIVETGGFTDAGTGRPYFSEIWIGAQTQRETENA